jgi:hypothetical protein
MARRLAFLALIVCLTTVVLLGSRRSPANVTDEGYLLAGVHRCQTGQLPGADFHAYMPLRYWLAAAVATESPMPLLRLRDLEMVVLVGAMLLFLAAVPGAGCPRALVVVAALVFVVAPGPWHKAVEIAAVLGVATAGTRMLQAQRRTDLLILGLSCGIAGAVRMELGAAVLVLSLVAAGWRRPERPALVLAGALVPMLVLGTPYLAAGRWRDGISFYSGELISSLSGLGAATNPYLSGPDPAGSEASVRWLLPLAFVAVVAVIVAAAGRLLVTRSRDRSALLLTVIALVRMVPVLHGLDASHLLQGMPTAYLPVLAVQRGRLRWLCLVILIVVHLGIAVNTEESYYTGSWRAGPDCRQPETGVLNGVWTPP